MALQLRHLVQLLCLCFWDWTWSPAKPLRNALLQEVSTHAQEEDECSYKARWFEQAVKIPSSINTIYVLTIVSYSLQHFSSSEGSFHRFGTTAAIKPAQNTHVCCVCSLFWTGSSPIMTSQNPVPTIFRRFSDPFRLYGQEKEPFSTSNISAMF